MVLSLLGSSGGLKAEITKRKRGEKKKAQRPGLFPALARFGRDTIPLTTYSYSSYSLDGGCRPVGHVGRGEGRYGNGICLTRGKRTLLRTVPPLTIPFNAIIRMCPLLLRLGMAILPGPVVTGRSSQRSRPRTTTYVAHGQAYGVIRARLPTVPELHLGQRGEEEGK